MVDVVKRLNLDLDGLSEKKKLEVKNEIGRFIIDATLEEVSKGISPVSGYGKFKPLNKIYADMEKGGNRTSNMELTGSMLDAYKFKKGRSGEDWIEIGIWGKEGDKAQGHNQHDGLGESELPLRRFIPDQDENYKRDIQSEIKKIIQEAKESSQIKIRKKADRGDDEGEDEISTIIDVREFLMANRQFMGFFGEDIDG